MRVRGLEGQLRPSEMCPLLPSLYRSRLASSNIQHRSAINPTIPETSLFARGLGVKGLSRRSPPQTGKKEEMTSAWDIKYDPFIYLNKSVVLSPATREIRIASVAVFLISLATSFFPHPVAHHPFLSLSLLSFLPSLQFFFFLSLHFFFSVSSLYNTRDAFPLLSIS